VTNKLKVTAGLRWYKYAYRFSEYFGGWGSALGAATPSHSGLITQNASGVNPKLNISYEFSKDLMAYATAARGFRPGGGNAPLPTTGPYWSQVFSAYGYTGTKWPSTYQPDSVWSYEIGEKARFFQRRLIINASLYYENWKDIQLESLPGDWPMNINGKYAHIFGGEIETQAILGAGFTLNLSGSYVNYKLNAGPHWQITPATKLTDVAPVTADISLNYTHELNSKYTFRSRIDTNYVSRRYSLAFPFGYSLNGEYVPVAAYSLTNLRAGVESADGWTVTAFVNNVFNKHAALEDMLQESLPDAAFNRVITNQPLTAGVDLNFKF
jgi:outer membrane receptor protein involved in Fe transport